MVANTWVEIEYRLEILRATNGAYLEVYWSCKYNFTYRNNFYNFVGFYFITLYIVHLGFYRHPVLWCARKPLKVTFHIPESPYYDDTAALSTVMMLDLLSQRNTVAYGTLKLLNHRSRSRSSRLWGCRLKFIQWYSAAYPKVLQAEKT